MSETTLIMTVGLPRSGKTTLAKRAAHPMVNPDAIRLALHGQPYVQSAEGIVWAVAHLMVKALFEAGHPTVILDGCNNTRRRRDEWKRDADQRIFWVVPTASEVCLSRLEGADNNPLSGVIIRMAAQHEPVELDEGECRVWTHTL